MIIYFDASALAKRYVEEESSAEVVRWLEASTPATSRLSEVEIASALARRCREGAISGADRDRALAALARDLRALHVVEVSPSAVSQARALVLRYPLLAADAVQLASAVLLREKLRTPIAFLAFDERLTAASETEGLLRPPRPG